MRNRVFILSSFCLAALLIVTVLVLNFTPRHQVPGISLPANQPDNTALKSPAQTPVGSATAPSTPPPEWVDKAVAMRAIWATENSKPQDFYGRIIDQYNQPVEGVTAIGTLMQIQGMDTATRKETHTTASDKNGDFEFTGLQGWQLGVVVKKEGYEMGQGAGVYQAPNAQDKTSPAERAIFKIWKHKSAEPMVVVKLDDNIPCDGNAVDYNLLTGKRAHNGDLTVKLTRHPVNITSGKPFDWTLEIAVPSGGLIEQSDPYPNEAPAEGYQSPVTIDMPAKSATWSGHLNRSYYFKSQGGKIYGHITIEIYADFQPPPTTFSALIYANPAGSRNLEFDPAKQIHK